MTDIYAPGAVPEPATPAHRITPAAIPKGRCARPPSSAICVFHRAQQPQRDRAARDHRPGGTATGSRCGTRCRAPRAGGRIRRRLRHAGRERAHHLPVRGRRVRQRLKVWPHQLLAAFAARQMPPGQARAHPQADLRCRRLPPDQPSAVGNRRRPSGTHRRHHPRRCPSRTRATRSIEDASRARAVPVHLAEHALDHRTVPLGRQPAADARARAPSPAPSRSNAHGRPRTPARMDPIESGGATSPPPTRKPACRSPPGG